MIPKGLFDEVIVISLPASSDRRAHIRDHFRDQGIVEYTFFDAHDLEAPEVSALYDTGQVKQYPPCFRCGKLECGTPDCNNVLIPQQVAVFSTYLALWRKLSATDGRYLICEDDVVFHPWAGKVLNQIAQQVSAGTLPFSGSQPSLLRLGWGHNAEHDEATDFRIDKSVRMSNPCHAVTGTFARGLLAEFNGVEHTADVFQHRLASVAAAHSRTVYPPVATELSWSFGTFQSLIHPKELHAAHLERTGRFEEAKAYREKISRHFRDIAHKTPEQ